MKRSIGNTIDISQAVGFFVKSLPVFAQQQVKAITLKDKWASLMGEFVARRTSKIYISGNTLFLKFDSQALKQDLRYRATEVLEKVQKVDSDVKRIFWY